MYFIIALILLITCEAKDTFKENLVISNLNDAISFHFDFQTTTSDLLSNNYHLFPKSISEIVKQYSVSEMHLALSKGFWNTDKWGLSPVSLPSESAELWAWFEPFENMIDNKWEHLSHALSGLFCTSLNKLSSRKEIITPEWTYNPEGLTNKIRNNSLVRKSALSGEAICTENLTPWIKLLPCKKFSGLAQLLTPSRLFSAHFTSITVGVKKVCLTENCNIIGRLIHQTITLVLDRKIFGNYYNVWSLRELLNTETDIELCHLAETSRIYLHGFGVGAAAMSLTVKPSGFLANESIAYYDLKNRFTPTMDNKISLDLSGPWPGSGNGFDPSRACLVQFTKFATGSGKIRGGIKSIIQSASDHPIRMAYLDSLAWYFQFQFSSLRIRANSSTFLKPKKIHYVPSLTRERMTHLELIIDVPAHSTVTIEYEFRKLLQNWNEFPPDANHEFYIGASSLTLAHSQAQRAFNESILDVLELVGITPSTVASPSRMVRLHSEVVLVTLPCPDFSMPFNALCLACTVIAIMIGGIHKYTTSSVYVVDPSKDGLKGKIILFIGFIQAKILRKSPSNTGTT